MQSQAADSLNPPAVSATFANGVADSLPIVIGYVPVAFAFGLSAVKLGFSPLESIFFSCIIYAGASQFVITASAERRDVAVGLRVDGDGDGCAPPALRPGAAPPHRLAHVAR
jgi:Predicted branched-chain amino acid permease (azaleucine resistance)